MTASQFWFEFFKKVVFIYSLEILKAFFVQKEKEILNIISHACENFGHHSNTEKEPLKSFLFFKDYLIETFEAQTKRINFCNLAS